MKNLLIALCMSAICSSIFLLEAQQGPFQSVCPPGASQAALTCIHNNYLACVQDVQATVTKAPAAQRIKEILATPMAYMQCVTNYEQAISNSEKSALAGK